MRKSLYILILLSGICQADSTDQYRKIDKVYLNGVEYTHFYLEGLGCPQAKSYFSLFPEKIDVDRAYALVLGAYMAEKKVILNYDTTTNFCQVTSISVSD